MDALRAIADAVLYEGYVLWPYRRSALKNQRRWTFGGVYPKAHSEGREDDPWLMRTQCLVQPGANGRVGVEVRFLQVVDRRVYRQTAQGVEPVDAITVGGRRHLAWEEAVEREIAVPELYLGELPARAHATVEIPAAEEGEELLEPGGARAGAIVRSWQALRGAVEVAADQVGEGVVRITVEISNTTPWTGGPRELALKQTFCSTHTVLRVRDGEFVSMTDPPEELAEAARACHNDGTWPVLVGEPGDRHTMLSAPIILEDHPRIAPESPGDLFDGGEIDQMLVLNILSLTDEEKAEMRDSDPRTREILERTEALSQDEILRLHGAIREFGMVRER